MIFTDWHVLCYSRSQPLLLRFMEFQGASRVLRQFLKRYLFTSVEVSQKLRVWRISSECMHASVEEQMFYICKRFSQMAISSKQMVISITSCHISHFMSLQSLLIFLYPSTYCFTLLRKSWWEGLRPDFIGVSKAKQRHQVAQHPSPYGVGGPHMKPHLGFLLQFYERLQCHPNFRQKRLSDTYMSLTRNALWPQIRSYPSACDAIVGI